jgi:hypothetical protein
MITVWTAAAAANMLLGLQKTKERVRRNGFMTNENENENDITTTTMKLSTMSNNTTARSQTHTPALQQIRVNQPT